MSPELISILALVAIFVIASALPISLGILAFAMAYLVGSTVGGLTPDDIFGGFPSQLFVLLVGVTYLFAIAQANGTVEWIIQRGVRLVRGRIALIPWLMYGLTALLAAMGALAAAALACVAPIAMRSAERYSINPLMMGIMCCLGSVGGSFSPISPFGVITNGTLSANKLPTSPGLLFVNNLVFSAVVAALVFFVLGGMALWRRGTVESATENDVAPDLGTGSLSRTSFQDGGSGSARMTSSSTATATTVVDSRVDSRPTVDPLTMRQVATLMGIAALVVGSLVFGLDVGLLAFVIATPLALFAIDSHTEVVTSLPWSVILLISGVLTYVGVLEQIGTLEYVGDLINGGNNALLAALGVAYIGALVSAFAATSGVLVATIPMVVPVLLTHDLSVIGTVTALTIASSLVDSSPMSTNGALLLANQRTMPERVFFRQLLVWAALTVVLGPPTAWFIFVVIGG